MQESCKLYFESSAFHRTFPLISAIKRYPTQLSHRALLATLYLPKGLCAYQENTSESWDIPPYVYHLKALHEQYLQVISHNVQASFTGSYIILLIVYFYNIIMCDMDLFSWFFFLQNKKLTLLFHVRLDIGTTCTWVSIHVCLVWNNPHRLLVSTWFWASRALNG